jgi:Na+-translocating ferredoxin:NAD+ oxidoreductase subunit B
MAGRRARHVAVIDEAWCIGCTLCIKACPVDCIVGTPSCMHTMIEADCTGCELCMPACPVDCISLESATPGRTGWAAWSEADASTALQRYTTRQARLAAIERSEAERLAQSA